MKAHVKILFTIDRDDSESTEIESVWAIPIDNGYKIDNIPFYAREIALGDIVSARPDADSMLRFEELVEPSQHSTVRLWFAVGSEGEVPRVRQELRQMGCSSERSDLNRLVAVDIPPSVVYAQIHTRLSKYEQEGLREFEEACLGKL